MGLLCLAVLATVWVTAIHRSEAWCLNFLMLDRSLKKLQNPSCSCKNEPFGSYFIAVEVKLQNKHLAVSHRILTCIQYLVQLVQISKNVCTVHNFFLNSLQSVLQAPWDRSFLQLIF